MNRILIIEDERGLGDTLSDLIEDSGYAVLLARDGEEGLKVALEKTPDLILCDLNMPKMDGYQVFLELKGILHDLIPPFICMSAKMGSNDAVKAMKIGVNHYVTKPFSINDVLHSIEHQLGRIKDSQKH